MHILVFSKLFIFVLYTHLYICMTIYIYMCMNVLRSDFNLLIPNVSYSLKCLLFPASQD